MRGQLVTVRQSTQRMEASNKAGQRTGASRSAQGQIQPQRRLAPSADLRVHLKSRGTQVVMHRGSTSPSVQTRPFPAPSFYLWDREPRALERTGHRYFDRTSSGRGLSSLPQAFGLASRPAPASWSKGIPDPPETYSLEVLCI